MGQYCNCYIEILFSFSLFIDLKKKCKEKKNNYKNKRKNEDNKKKMV